jgi:hypothetical protein
MQLVWYWWLRNGFDHLHTVLYYLPLGVGTLVSVPLSYH